MATNLPPNIGFDKMQYFDKAATKIQQTFDSLIDQLIVGRDALLQRIQELREDHKNKEASRIAAFEELQQQIRKMKIRENPNKEIHQKAKEVYQQGLRKHQPSATFLCPIFRCQRIDTIHELIAELGEIVPCEVPNYSLKKDPILTAGKLGSARGIAFDDTNELIYIADWINRRVQMVSLKGEIVAQFGNDSLLIPCGIAITDEYIFVTDTGYHALFQFRKKDFKLLNSVGNLGDKEGQLNTPSGLCIETNGDVLIADTWNKRVCIFSKQLKFESCIGIGQLNYPTDVKLSDNRVVVLDWNTKCVHFFSRDGHLLSSCVSRGRKHGSLVYHPSFFCLDAANNIIISDFSNHAIKIFTELGEYIHTIGREGNGKGEFTRPFGICISKLGNIFVVSNNPNYPLQCF